MSQKQDATEKEQPRCSEACKFAQYTKHVKALYFNQSDKQIHFFTLLS